MKQKNWGVVEFWNRRGTRNLCWSKTHFYSRLEAHKKMKEKLRLEELDYETERVLVKVLRRKER